MKSNIGLCGIGKTSVMLLVVKQPHNKYSFCITVDH